jgi:hypothetical protein
MTDTLTPGPWFAVAADDMDFTAISTSPHIDKTMDLPTEVLGASEWLRVKRADLFVMAASREMLDLLTGAVGGIGHLARASGLNTASWLAWEERAQAVISKALTVTPLPARSGSTPEAYAAWQGHMGRTIAGSFSGDLAAAHYSPPTAPAKTASGVTWQDALARCAIFTDEAVADLARGQCVEMTAADLQRIIDAARTPGPQSQESTNPQPKGTVL